MRAYFLYTRIYTKIKYKLETDRHVKLLFEIFVKN